MNPARLKAEKLLEQDAPLLSLELLKALTQGHYLTGPYYSLGSMFPGAENTVERAVSMFLTPPNWQNDFSVVELGERLATVESKLYFIPNSVANNIAQSLPYVYNRAIAENAIDRYHLFTIPKMLQKYASVESIEPLMERIRFMVAEDLLKDASQWRNEGKYENLSSVSVRVASYLGLVSTDYESPDPVRTRFGTIALSEFEGPCKNGIAAALESHTAERNSTDASKASNVINVNVSLNVAYCGTKTRQREETYYRPKVELVEVDRGFSEAIPKYKKKEVCDDVPVCTKPIHYEKYWLDWTDCYTKDIKTEKSCRMVNMPDGFDYRKRTKMVTERRTTMVPVKKMVTEHIFEIRASADYHAADGTKGKSSIVVSPRGNKQSQQLRNRAFNAFASELYYNKYFVLEDSSIAVLGRMADQKVIEGNPLEIGESFANLWTSGYTIFGAEIAWLAESLKIPVDLLVNALDSGLQSPMEFYGKSKLRALTEAKDRLRQKYDHDQRIYLMRSVSRYVSLHNKYEGKRPEAYDHSNLWRGHFVEFDPSYFSWPTVKLHRKSELSKIGKTEAQWNTLRRSLLDPYIPEPKDPT